MKNKILKLINFIIKNPNNSFNKTLISLFQEIHNKLITNNFNLTDFIKYNNKFKDNIYKQYKYYP